MSYFVYLIVSNLKKNKKISYVGYTNNLKKRISLHNQGKGAKFTRGRKWKLIYKRKYLSKKEAMKYEFNLKKNFTKRKNIKLKYINKFV